jgi:hypothetical protein
MAVDLDEVVGPDMVAPSGSQPESMSSIKKVTIFGAPSSGTHLGEVGVGRHVGTGGARRRATRPRTPPLGTRSPGLG